MNGLLCIYKEKNMTSFDALRTIKRVFKTKKVGHSGTLDPNATGVLVVAINRATKSLPYLDVFDKIYHAKIKLGNLTHTGDVWGDIVEEKPVESYTKEALQNVIDSFIGKISQRVPMVSAKRIDGKRLYQYVLDGETVETQYTDIEIYSIELLSYSADEIEIRAHVSNGTYIRTLCEDIAEKLNNLGTMFFLEREQVGKFDLSHSIKLEDITLETPLLAVKDHLSLPVIEAFDQQRQIMHGQRLELDTEHDKVVLDANEFYAIYEREIDNTFKSVRGLW